MNPLKVYGTIALVLILGVVVGSVIYWDNSRLQAEYDRGVLAERGVWQAEVAKAKAAVHAKTNALTLKSEQTADTARTLAQAVTAATLAANQSTLEKIEDAYKAEPMVPCRSDTVPKRLPGGVLDGLAEARAAALGGTSTSSGGLQSTQRKQSASPPDD